MGGAWIVLTLVYGVLGNGMYGLAVLDLHPNGRRTLSDYIYDPVPTVFDNSQPSPNRHGACTGILRCTGGSRRSMECGQATRPSARRLGEPTVNRGIYIYRILQAR